MAGTFDNAISFVEIPIGTLTVNTTAATVVTSQAFTFPQDIEIVGASARGVTGATAAAHNVLLNLYNGATSTTDNLMWTATSTTTSASRIRVDQGVVTVTTAAAHGLTAGQTVKISGVTADTNNVLSAAFLAIINDFQVVTSAPTTTTFTFGPLKQAAFYDNVTGFWKFTLAPVTPASGGAVTLWEQPILTSGTSNSVSITGAAYSPDKIVQRGYYGDQTTPKYASLGFIPAGNIVTPTYFTADTSFAASAVVTAATLVTVTMNLAVKKA
jgi:hypothetical protein